jgi:RNA polymerase sigma-70 factor (ECF subfamily)
MESLPEPYRRVFTARHIEEMNTLEAASHLGISEQCVKTRLSRARGLLRRRIRRHVLHPKR